MGKIIDITNQTFGYLTALYPTRINGRFAWHCRCVCGKELDVDSNSLRYGKTKSCGCKHAELISQANIKDKTGQRFGYLTVLGPEKERVNKQIMWKCQCDCGNITYVSTSNLSRNHTRSCGCKTNQMIGEAQRLKLLDQRFGKLVVIKELASQNYESRWLCQCDCGNTIEAIGWHLTKGLISSCGCLVSKGEAKIQQLLSQAHIPFIQQATFDDCLSPNGYKLRFDFYVNNEYIIEFDGEQHFMTTPNSLYTLDRLQTIQEHDTIKNQWCQSHGIPLIRIKYTQLNTLTLEDLLLMEDI